MAGKPNTRIERDSLGEIEVPAGAYYGVQTLRAVQNFPISDLRFPRRFIRALALIKKAAAEVNVELGLLDAATGRAIAEAAEEVADGRHDSQFVVDIFQTGSGTSTNMNANEVISNRAIEMLGGRMGSKSPAHPNDHVNLGQSSNDVIPPAIHISAATAIVEGLIPALRRLQASLEKKAEEFMPVIKTGRTHLQDATPIRLGQEFHGYAGQVERGIHRLDCRLEGLSEVALGGTAVGTGINTHPEFAGRVCEKLSAMLGIQVYETENHFQAQAALDAVVDASGVLKSIAVSLHKIASDIRWLGSGPRAGIGEIVLPEVQPGSSIMPGKVNPVIPESVLQVAARVIGNDVTITLGGQGGAFELNLMMPVMAYCLLQSIDILAAAADDFARQCVDGLKATVRGPELVESGLALGTALAPVIGYDAAAEIAKEAARTGKTIRQVARERTSLTEEQLSEILDPTRMTEPGFFTGGGGG